MSFKLQKSQQMNSEEQLVIDLTNQLIDGVLLHKSLPLLGSMKDTNFQTPLEKQPPSGNECITQKQEKELLEDSLGTLKGKA